MSAAQPVVSQVPPASAASAPAPSNAAGDPSPLLPPAPRLFVPIPDPQRALPAGSSVKRGDILVASTNDLEYVPHAPVSGIVRGTREVQRIGADRSHAVEIEVDPTTMTEASTAPTRPTGTPPTDLPSLIELLRTGNVRAQRHTSPPLLAQLQAASQRKLDTILCNGLDATGESDLVATVLRSHGDAVMAGLSAVAKAVGVNRIWLAADTRVATAAQPAIRRFAASGARPAVKIIDIPNDYPQADPTLLVYAILKRCLRPGRLPTDVNVIILDASAAAAVGRRVTTGQPVLDVTVEVRESDREACSVRTVAVGTPLSYLLEQLWLKPKRLTLRAGAALRDIRVSPDAVIDGVGELSIEVGPLSPLINPDPCIRCGWCVEACPVQIQPAGILEAAQDNDLRAARWYGMGSCIECGICSYVCPSRLPLLPAIRQLKLENARREM